ncbi:hypothetical protein ACSEQ9_32705 [Pseudomonas aeruginosa]
MRLGDGVVVFLDGLVEGALLRLFQATPAGAVAAIGPAAGAGPVAIAAATAVTAGRGAAVTANMALTGVVTATAPTAAATTGAVIATAVTGLGAAIASTVAAGRVAATVAPGAAVSPRRRTVARAHVAAESTGALGGEPVTGERADDPAEGSTRFALSGADTTINRTDGDLTTEVIDEAGNRCLVAAFFIERASQNLALILPAFAGTEIKLSSLRTPITFQINIRIKKNPITRTNHTIENLARLTWI